MYNRVGKLKMLYLYGTVYNNRNRVLECINSLNKINTQKKFLIVDNYSTDGTYETLKNFQEIEIIRVKCSRGKGRQLAMELARDRASLNDMFMTFDLDTVYSYRFVKAVEWGMSNIDHRTVFISNLCYYDVNFTIPWKDLNNGEDWERMANFCYTGYNVLNVKFNYAENEEVGNKSRERRYAKGFAYLKRQWRNNEDLFMGWGINNLRKLREFIRFLSPKMSKKKLAILSIFFLSVFIIVKLFKKPYSYSDSINRLYVSSHTNTINSDIFSN